MRRFWIFFLAMILMATLHAQDVIVLRDSSKIQAKVLSVSDTGVFYKKWNNLEGPSYTMDVNRVLAICYADGTVSTNRELRNTRPFIRKTRFQSYFSFGFYSNKYNLGLVWTGSFGARIFDYGYVGVKLGYILDFDNMVEFPIQFDFRGYYPINRKVHPYIEFSPGVMVSPSSRYYSNKKNFVDFSYQLGVGFDISHFSFGFGYYRGPRIEYDEYSSKFYRFFYAKIGVKFGKNY